MEPTPWYPDFWQKKKGKKEVSQRRWRLGVWVVGRRDKHWWVARGASLAWFHNREHLQEYIGFMSQLAQAMGDELAALGPTDTVDIHLRPPGDVTA